MSGVVAAFVGQGGAIDTLTMTVGGDGTVQNGDRRRGFISGTFGSLSKSTFSIFSGAITSFYWDQPTGTVTFSVTSAPNSGWTSLSIGSDVLLRSDATYSSGIWTWISGNVLGNVGATPTIVLN